MGFNNNACSCCNFRENLHFTLTKLEFKSLTKWSDLIQPIQLMQDQTIFNFCYWLERSQIIVLFCINILAQSELS